MAVKEIPTNYRVYYKSMRNTYTQLKDNALTLIEDLIKTINVLHEDIKSNKDQYKDEFGIDILKYEEFVDNEYKTGTFLRLAKGAFLNRKNNYVLVGALFDVYNLAKKQKEIYELNKDVAFYNKLLNLTLNEYKNILKVFYTEVQKHLILKGEGYVFENVIGWICINRCHINKVKPHINFAETKKKKAELLAEGKRLYNKEEAAWCKQNGIKYDGIDARVYLNNEYCYEVPLIQCKLPNGHKYKLDISDYRSRELRSKSNKKIMEEYGSNLEDICNLDLDLRTKLNMCVELDKTLYTNFIRNENQEPLNAAKIDR